MPGTDSRTPFLSISFRRLVWAIPIVAVAILGLSLTATSGLQASEKPVADTQGTEVAILAGGCFWGMEHLLRDLDGVLDTEVGMISAAGAKGQDPAESVRIEYDPDRITYEKILRFYFRIHDPTTLNRQGNDRGTQYRSAIFVLDRNQEATAERVLADVDASGFWRSPLVTQILPAGTFKASAQFHQDYLIKNPGGYTCHFIRGE